MELDQERSGTAMNWFTENAGTILVSLVLVLLVAFIVRGLIRDKREGRSSCGGDCGCCPMGGACHKPQAKAR